MDIIKQDFKTGEVTIRITDEEDLWHLSHIIQEPDLVEGQTERKIKIGTEENFKVARKKVHLKLETEKTEYVPENNTLRILGTIKQGPEDVPLGSYHSFSLEINDIIKITKEWPNYQIKRLQESTKPRKKSIIAIFDREEAIIGILSNKGFEKITEIKGDVQKKKENTQSTNTFYKDVAKKIQEQQERTNTERIILGSPAFWKEYLLKELPENLRKKTITTTISSVDETGIKEILTNKDLGKTLEDDRLAKEEKLIEEIMIAIKEEKAFYGLEDAKEKINIASAQKIIVSENLLKKTKDKGTYKEIEELLKTGEATQAEIHIITQKETTTKIDSLGGIAGTTRWKTQN